MNLSLLNIIGIEILEVPSNDGFPTILFRNIQESFVTALRMHNDLSVNDTFWLKVNNKIRTLIYNRLKFDDKVYKNEKEIVEFIEKNYPLYNPQEKLNIVLEFLYKRTSYDGQQLDLDIQSEIIETELWRKYFFTNAEEFEFYISNLKEQGLIEYHSAGYELIGLTITLDGLSKLIKLNEHSNSRQCFVAMSFDLSLKTIYSNAIQPAIVETGFIPFIVNDQHVESDKTINDAIIAGIKRSHFTIADFTMHRAGVYFESGYALGRGQKVIYTCRKDDIENAHFDTRNFQHIVWETEEELRTKLIDKINATIIN